VGASRLIRFAYAAQRDSTAYTATIDVELRVKPVLSLKVNRKSLPNGKSVTFTGRLPGAPKGSRKVIELQAKVGSGWRTFATVRLGRKGTFRHSYRFTATTQTRSYVFRARLRKENGFPFESGYSKVTRVKVYA
jgi:hypothetical protein